MTVADIRELLDAEVVTGKDGLDVEVRVVCACDLMSDVLSYVQTGAILLTGLTNPQAVRTAEMAEIAAICFVRGKKPPPQTIQLAKEKGIPLLCSRATMFEACGRLHTAGAKGY